MRKISIITFIALFSSTTFADDADRRVKVANRSGQTIRHIYGSNVAESSWENDILGTDVLVDGQNVIINFDDGTNHCLFDVKVVLADGSARIKRRVNVCMKSSLLVGEI